MKESAKGTFYALLSVSMFATLGTGFKVAVNHIDSYSVVVWIGIFATLALFIYLAAEGQLSGVKSVLRDRPLFFPLAGVIGLGVQQILCLRTYELIPASQAVILHYTYPLILLLLSGLVYREKTDWRGICCVLTGFAGVCILVVSGGGLGDVRLSTGIAVALGTAFTFALFCLLIKHTVFPVAVGMFLFNLFGLLFLLCLLPIYQFAWKVSLADLGLLAYLGVFPTAVAFILWNKALRMIPTGHASNCALLVPILSLICISLVLKERIVFMQGVGMVIVFSSVFLNVTLASRI